MMRAIWTLIVCCLMAAGGSRPSVRTRAPEAPARLRAAHDALPVLVARAHHDAPARARAAHPDAIVGDAPALPPPPRAAIVARTAAPHALAARTAPTRSARGPPLV